MNRYSFSFFQSEVKVCVLSSRGWNWKKSKSGNMEELGKENVSRHAWSLFDSSKSFNWRLPVVYFFCSRGVDTVNSCGRRAWAVTVRLGDKGGFNAATFEKCHTSVSALMSHERNSISIKWVIIRTCLLSITPSTLMLPFPGVPPEPCRGESHTDCSDSRRNM